MNKYKIIKTLLLSTLILSTCPCFGDDLKEQRESWSAWTYRNFHNALECVVLDRIYFNGYFVRAAQVMFMHIINDINGGPDE